MIEKIIKISFLSTLVLLAPHPLLAAACDPTKTLCLHEECSGTHLGESTLDLDKKNIIVCLLKDDASGHIWKSLTSPNETKQESIPSGAVVAFDAATCPTGWAVLNDVAGRAIIGAGKGAALTNRLLRESGGAETHVLTLAEMPSHAHNYTSPLIGGLPNLVHDTNGTAVEYPTDMGDETTFAGSGHAHNNMMPYYALLYCKKE